MELRFLPIILLVFSYYFGSTQPVEFVYTPTNLSGVMYGQVLLNGVSAKSGDWIAAFDEEGNCAGASQLIINSGKAYINLTIYGDDPTTQNMDEGINSNESFILKVWDNSENSIITYKINSEPYLFEGWINTNGTPIPEYSNYNQVYDFVYSYLPIPSLVNFQLKKQNTTIFLMWSINQSANLMSFDIEYSVSGRDFRKIGEVSITNEFKNKNSFSFAHTKPDIGANYYRLKLIDIDGLFEYSKTVLIYCDDSEITSYPNPTERFVNISSNHKSDLSIYDNAGNLIEKFIINKGNNSIDLLPYPTGLYFIKSGNKVMKIIKE